MVSSRRTFNEVMTPRNPKLATIFVTDTFKRHYALLGICDFPYGNGNINDWFSRKSTDCRAPHMFDGDRLLIYSLSQSRLFFSKQLMPQFSVRHQPYYIFW